MRLLLVVLLLANGLFVGYYEGWLGKVPTDSKEPQRLTQQVHPERLRLLDAAQENAMARVAVATPVVPRVVACKELGGFAPEDAQQVSEQLKALNLGDRLSERHVEEQAGYIVYLPPFRTHADAERAATEVRRMGVEDFFIMQDPGPYHLAISLGVFRTEDAAKAQLTQLTKKGVRNARTGPRPATVSRSYFVIRQIDGPLMAQLDELRRSYAGQEFHDCGNETAIPSPATSSSGT